MASLCWRSRECTIHTSDVYARSTRLPDENALRRAADLLNQGKKVLILGGLPYTIAAHVAYPERQCVAFVGDGGFSMLMAEFATCVKYQLPIRGPVIVEAVVDPFEPPMPAKVKLAQAAKFAESLAKGELNRKKIALTILSDKVREMV